MAKAKAGGGAQKTTFGKRKGGKAQRLTTNIIEKNEITGQGR